MHIELSLLLHFVHEENERSNSLPFDLISSRRRLENYKNKSEKSHICNFGDRF